MVFIGGVGRSGTSVTRQAMGLHPDVMTFPFEYRFLIDPDGIIDFVFGHQELWSPYLYDRKLKRLSALLHRVSRKRFSEQLFSKMLKYLAKAGLHYSQAQYLNWELEKHFTGFRDAINNYLKKLSQFSYRGYWIGVPSYQSDYQINYVAPDHQQIVQITREFLSDLFIGLLDENQKSTLVEDNTWNLLYCQQLLTLFPSARFIHVHRDPRDVVCSYLKQNWMPSDLAEAATICRDLYQRIFQTTATLNSSQFRQISLGHLVTDYATVMGQLLDFCNLPHSVGMQNLTMDDSVLGIWKKQLTEQQQHWLTNFFQFELNHLGYLNDN